MCHSYVVIKKQIKIKKLNKKDPSIIKNKASGISIIELSIVVMIYHQFRKNNAIL